MGTEPEISLKLRPIELVVLQGTSFCNLNCTYCDLSVESRRKRSIMPAEVLDAFFTQLFESGLASSNVLVTWHSGEPLTLPVSYYQEAIGRILALRNAHGAERISLRFDFQTNGVLISDAWCDFFRDNSHIVDLGVSCDGPAELHDRYRVNWSNRATLDQTLRGMDMLEAAGVKYNVIAVVTKQTLAQVDAFFDFFCRRGETLSGFHFNILAEAVSGDANLSYDSDDRDEYYAFYRRLLDLSRSSHERGGTFKIRNFAHTLGRILRVQAGDAPDYVEETSAPLRTVNLDANGDVTTFYAGLGPEVAPALYGDGRGLSLGNIRSQSLLAMASSEKLRRIHRDFSASQRACKKACEYYPVCTGGFELTQKQRYGAFNGAVTSECVIHVQALVDALLDDIGEHIERSTAREQTSEVE